MEHHELLVVMAGLTAVICAFVAGAAHVAAERRAAMLDDAKERRDALIAELRRCATTFDGYAETHRAKGTQIGREKAASNEEAARRIRLRIAKALYQEG